jgi:REP element-mobilizing transposase RayT
MAQERMKHPPVRLTDDMIEIVAHTIAACVAKSNGGLSIAALAIEPTHLHVLIPYSGRDIHTTVKWLADQTTKAIHRQTNHNGPVWCKGKWCSFVFGPRHWQNLRRYIGNHNVRAGMRADPYPFITPIEF